MPKRSPAKRDFRDNGERKIKKSKEGASSSTSKMDEDLEGFASVLRWTALSIMDKGGVVRKMENLGEQELPHRMRAHTEWHTHGRYFLMHFDLGTEGLKELKHELGTDTDLIRPRIINVKSRYDSLKHRHSLLECWESYKPPSSFQPR